MPRTWICGKELQYIAAEEVVWLGKKKEKRKEKNSPKLTKEQKLDHNYVRKTEHKLIKTNTLISQKEPGW